MRWRWMSAQSELVIYTIGDMVVDAEGQFTHLFWIVGFENHILTLSHWSGFLLKRFWGECVATAIDHHWRIKFDGVNCKWLMKVDEYSLNGS